MDCVQMCTYISFVFPRTLTDIARERFFDLLQIRVRPVDATRFHPQIRKDETCWIRRDDCDCGTFVGNDTLLPSTGEVDTERDRARYKRRGWTDAKIERAIADRQTRSAQPRLHRDQLITNWTHSLNYLSTVPGLQYIGIVWHEYSGYIDTEKFKVGSAMASANNAINALQNLPENTVLRIEFRPSVHEFAHLT